MELSHRCTICQQILSTKRSNILFCLHICTFSEIMFSSGYACVQIFHNCEMENHWIVLVCDHFAKLLHSSSAICGCVLQCQEMGLLNKLYRHFFF